jgi:hypothetical protein
MNLHSFLSNFQETGPVYLEILTYKELSCLIELINISTANENKADIRKDYNTLLMEAKYQLVRELSLRIKPTKMENCLDLIL